MTDSDDLASLARRYVELWQDQIAAVSTDPELIESYLRLMARMAGTVGFAWPPKAAAPGHDGERSAADDRNDAPEPPGFSSSAESPCEAGAAPVAAASDDGVECLAQLEARIADLEKRLADLEGGSG